MRESELIQDIYEYSNGELAAQLGERFRNYRHSLGLSQKEIALNSSVSVRTIVRFEKGQGRSIRLDNLIALLSAYCKMGVCGTNTRAKRSPLYAFGERNGLRSRPLF